MARFRPMLAAASDDEDLSSLPYPLYGTPKVDGIRCLNIKGRALSRSLLPIANKHIRKCLAGLPPFDGELKVKGTFQDTTSGIMSEDGKPEFTYSIFDIIPDDPREPYLERMDELARLARKYKQPNFYFLFPTQVDNEKELNAYADECVKRGYEGAIFRTGDSPYKYGRSTFKQAWAIKVKPFLDDEAEVMWFLEAYANQNEALTDELGYTDRSTAQENLVPKDTLGAFKVWHDKFGLFKIGTGRGLTAKFRKEIWENQSKYRQRKIKFRYQLEGTKDKPRIPSFLGFRDERDMS